MINFTEHIIPQQQIFPFADQCPNIDGNAEAEGQYGAAGANVGTPHATLSDFETDRGLINEQGQQLLELGGYEVWNTKHRSEVTRDQIAQDLGVISM